MSIASYDIAIDQGETFTLNVQIRDPNTNASIIPLIASAKSQIKEAPHGTLFGEMVCTIDVVNDCVKIFLPASISAALNSPRVVWDLKITYTDGQVKFPIGGKIKITSTVTTI